MEIDFNLQHLTFSFTLLKRLMINNIIEKFMKQMQRAILVFKSFSIIIKYKK